MTQDKPTGKTTGDARFYTLLQHQGELVHRIGVPKTDASGSVLGVQCMRVGNLATVSYLICFICREIVIL